MYTFSVTSSYRKEEERTSSPSSSYTSSPYIYTTTSKTYKTSNTSTSTTSSPYTSTSTFSSPSYNFTTSTSSSSTSPPSYNFTTSTSSSSSSSSTSPPSYNFTTSTTSSPSTSPPSYNFTTSNTSSPSYTYTNSSPYSYLSTSTYSTTSTNSPSTALSFDLSSDNDDSPYHFTVTSDYLKKLSLKNDDDDTNPSSKSTSNTSYNFDNGTCSSSQKKKKEKECMICVESRSVRHFPKITKYCSHPNDICKLCVSKHIETQLNSKGDIEGILCPFGDSCGFLIEYNDVQSIVNSSLFEQYDSLSLKQALRSMPDFRWCKNAGCGSGQIHSGGDKEPIMTCEACGEKSCYTHDIPWHDNLSCEEYNEAKQGEDMATQDLLNRETKQCPKCGVRITKNGGCNHMTCKVQNCRYEFCWLCLADYDQIRRNGNHFHKRTCQLYA